MNNDEDISDERRLELLREAMNQDIVTIDVFPDEADPGYLHVYVIAPDITKFPIFVGVFDTSRHIGALLRQWVTDTWPGIRVPTFRL